MKKLLPTVLSIFALFVISGFAQTAYNDNEAYQVYAALLPAEWTVKEAKAKKLVIVGETSDFRSFAREKKESICLVPAEGEESIYAPVLKNYVDVNKTKWTLQRKFPDGISYELVPSLDIDAIFKTKGIEGWKDFYAKYPDSGGSITLSAVGFNADKTFAIAYVGHSCGGLCGGGRYHVLKKADGKWTEISWKGQSCSWAS
ncbi:MAG: hypothetical protein QM785_16665 [Pyrinomonadaceae bacterium]